MGIQGITSYGQEAKGGVTNGAYINRADGRSVAWHGTGEVRDSKGRLVGLKRQIIEQPTSADEMIDLMGGDWHVEARTLDELGVALDGANEVKVMYRPDVQRLLGIASEKYGVIQNRYGYEIGAEIIKHSAGQAKFVAGTELFGGQVMFLVFEWQDGVKAVRHNGRTTDQITRYMGVYWSHNGAYPLGVKFMNQLWVCRNTFTPTSGVTGITVRHTRNAADYAAAAVQAIEQMVVSNDQFDREVERLLEIEANRETMTRVVIPTVLGERPTTEGRSQTMFDNAFAGIVSEWTEYTDQSTAFDAVMAVQGWEQHRMNVRGKPRDIRCIERILRDDYPKTASAVEVFAPIPA